MASLLNNAGVQHYANKMVLAENRKVGSKNLPTALTNIDNLIDEMKTNFDAEYGSALDMKLENNENVFSVGTGTNVDRRSEVENSFTDVELSGNSLVNLIQEKSYLDWHVLYCGRKSSEGIFIGMGSKYSSQASPNNTTSTDVRCKIISKNNSVYTLIFDAKVIEGTSSEFTIVYNGICIRNTAKIKDGRNVILIRSDDSQNGTFQIYEVSGDNNESDINIRLTNIVILEGDWTNKPIPQYFQGMKSVGQDDVNGHKIEILSQNGNENLFKNNKGFYDDGMNNATYDRENCILTINNTYSHKSIRFIGVIDKDGIYTLSFKARSSATSRIDIDLVDKIATQIEIGTTEKEYSITFDTQSSVAYNPEIYHFVDFTTVDTTNNTIILSDIKLEIGTEKTPFNHKLNKKEISLNEPLRGLPNGVKDTIEKVNGEWKIVRRCSEVVLNGSEPWELLSDTDKEKTIGFRILNFLPLSRYGDKYKMVVCDRFPSYKHNLWRKDYEGITTENNINDVINDTQLQIIISKSELSTKNIAGFKEWLSQNPTKVIYELATPIIEDISPVTLQCWKNGTIFIDEVLPVETTHTVALNKPAQIKRNIEELTALRKRVQALEYFYDQVALEQAHQLSLINHSIELDYDI